MYWLLIRYVKTLFQDNDINICKLTGSKVIGLKFSGVTLLMDQSGGSFDPLGW